MKVVVLGAGIAGVTSAWYLARSGHTVCVVERQPAAGLETSYANGGQISVSHPEPWANPHAPWQILRWLLREDAPLKFRLRWDRHQWRWAARFLVECAPHRTTRNTAAIARLAVYSSDCLRRLRDETGLRYEINTTGILHLFFERHGITVAAKRAKQLRQYGIEADVLTHADCLDREPALADCTDHISAGLFAPNDESGDAHQCTESLALLAAKNGVEFLYNTRTTGWDASRDAVFGVRVRQPNGLAGTIRADAIVVCMGSFSPLLAHAVGDHLPIYPVKGYSVTLPISAGVPVPSVSITDEAHRIVCTRLGTRLRIAGTAELNGYDSTINQRRCEAIQRRAAQLFPRALANGQADYWSGLRPTTPGNVPIIGRGKYPTVFYNTGHGTLGWTLACGSARALVDLINGDRPEVDFPFLGLTA